MLFEITTVKELAATLVFIKVSIIIRKQAGKILKEECSTPYHPTSTTTSSCSTKLPSANTIVSTLPDLLATIVDSIFIASIVNNGVFFSTPSPTFISMLDNFPCNGAPISFGLDTFLLTFLVLL